MNPWWMTQEWACVCNRGDRWVHVHYAESPHACARCTECKGYCPDIPEYVAVQMLIGPEMTNEQATAILLGPKWYPCYCRGCGTRNGMGVSHAGYICKECRDGV